MRSRSSAPPPWTSSRRWRLEGDDPTVLTSTAPTPSTATTRPRGCATRILRDRHCVFPVRSARSTSTTSSRPTRRGRPTRPDQPPEPRPAVSTASPRQDLHRLDPPTRPRRRLHLDLTPPEALARQRHRHPRHHRPLTPDAPHPNRAGRRGPAIDKRPQQPICLRAAGVAASISPPRRRRRRARAAASTARRRRRCGTGRRRCGTRAGRRSVHVRRRRSEATSANRSSSSHWNMPSDSPSYPSGTLTRRRSPVAATKAGAGAPARGVDLEPGVDDGEACGRVLRLGRAHDEDG